MRTRLIAIIIALSAVLVASDKGVCPPAPPKWAASSATSKSKANLEKNQDKESVTLMVVVSDKGSVCSAEVLKGINRETDTDAITAVKSWAFKPATKDGRPVPVVVTVQVNYELVDGKLVRASKDPSQAHQD